MKNISDRTTGSTAKIHYRDTTLLRVIGILLIVNSHLDKIYPVKFIATGGAIGNSLFFALSSYGLYISYQQKPLPFNKWYKRRIFRLYPSIWISLVLLGLPYEFYFKKIIFQADKEITLNDIGIFIINFVCPLELWFIPALLSFYFIGFFIIKHFCYNKLYYTAVVVLFVYAIFYFNFTDLTVWSVEIQKIRYIFYFSIFIYGIHLAVNDHRIVYKGTLELIILLALISVLYAQKLAMLKGYFLGLQFLQQAIMFPIIYYFLKVNKSNKLHTLIDKYTLVSSSIGFVGKITLEIFIVHQYFVSSIYYLNISFPGNLLLICSLTLTMAMAINFIVKTIKNFFASTSNLSPG